MSADPRGPSGTGHDTAGRRDSDLLAAPISIRDGEPIFPAPVAVPGPASARPRRLRLIWNHLQAKLHHAYPCGKCGYAYNCPEGECHS